MPRITPEERRAEIMGAALRCFMRTGYNNTSMDDIVAESGLSKGTLYWHFKNKEDLFFSLFDKIIMDVMATTMQTDIDPALPVAEQIRRVLNGSVESFEQNPELFKLPMNFLIELWQIEGFMAHYKGVITTFADQIEALINMGIAKGEFREVDTHELTWAMMALIDGLILYHAVEMPGDVTRQFTLMLGLILDGLQK
jgi:AcrR family transcriptional regulator